VEDDKGLPLSGASVTRDVTLTSTPQRQTSSHDKGGKVSVLDCTLVELCQLTPEEIAQHDVKWLRQNLLHELERKRGISSHLKEGEELLLFTTFGNFLQDNQSLKEALSQTIIT
jgi:hypothetical protein